VRGGGGVAAVVTLLNVGCSAPPPAMDTADPPGFGGVGALPDLLQLASAKAAAATIAAGTRFIARCSRTRAAVPTMRSPLDESLRSILPHATKANGVERGVHQQGAYQDGHRR
jgi:hypothetical protein